MANTISIGGVDRTSYVRLESVTVRNTIVATTDSLEAVVSVYDGSWTPQAGNEVIWTNGGTTEFGGICMSLTETMVNPSHYKYRIMCKDYTWLLDRRLVARQYTTVQAADVVVKDILSTFTSGFTTTNVEAAPAVNPQTFDYEPVSSTLHKLADLIQWGWYVDYNKDLHFFDLETFAAPVASIDFDSSVNTDYRNLEITERIDQERNRVYMKGYPASSTTTLTDHFTGNGSQGQYQLYSSPTQLSDVSVTRNGIAQTVKTDFVDGQPGDGIGDANTVFVCFDNMGLRWNTPPSNGDVIVATYKYVFPGITVVDDPAAQTIMQAREGGDGIHEYAITDPAMSDTIATDRANGYLHRYSRPRLLGSFDSYTQGWKAGQAFTGISAKRMGGFTKTLYVQSVTKQIVSVVGGVVVINYHIEFSDNPLSL